MEKMKISKNSKLGVALAVLKKIKIKEKDVNIDMYSNCREQGFFLKCFMKIEPLGYGKQRAVSFSENRSSDNIIVQYGVVDDFNRYGVVINDEKYNSQKKYFKPDEAEKAAQFIEHWLKYSKELDIN
jgi:hypothetical protein